MFFVIDKEGKKGYSSKSKREISKVLGIGYHSVCYYYRKGWYDGGRYIFCRGDHLKSGQGGMREGGFGR